MKPVGSQKKVLELATGARVFRSETGAVWKEARETYPTQRKLDSAR